MGGDLTERGNLPLVLALGLMLIICHRFVAYHPPALCFLGSHTHTLHLGDLGVTR